MYVDVVSCEVEKKRKEEINLHRQRQESVREIPAQDRGKYNDSVGGNFLFVGMVDHRDWYVNQDRIRCGIFLVLSSFGNKFQWAKIINTSIFSSKSVIFTK